MNIIDPHLHLFDLEQGQYHWLKAENQPHWPDKAKICRDFSEADLILPNDWILAGYVHIEAGFDNTEPGNELDWLEQTSQMPFKSIASVDLNWNEAHFAEQLQAICQYTSSVGVRHILDQDALPLLNSSLSRSHFSLINQHELIFETQLNFTDMAACARLLQTCKHYTRIKWMINHAGFPSPNNPVDYSLWLKNMRLLSQQDNVFVKASGWEMSDRHYQMDWVEQLLRDLLILFGDSRVMLASNFPLCTFSHRYRSLWKSYGQLSLPSKQLEKLCHDNAKTLYCF